MNDGAPRVKLQESRSDWTLRVKLARVLWKPAQLFLRMPGPRQLSPLRVMLLKLYGARIEGPVLILGGVKIWFPWNLEIGEFSAIGFNVEIYNFAPVRIGKQSVISQYVYLCTASHRYEFGNMPLYFEPITIGEQSWVAAGAFIGPGISIGDGAVVGARSVVTKDVAPWTVAAGNPAKVIRERKLRA